MAAQDTPVATPTGMPPLSFGTGPVATPAGMPPLSVGTGVSRGSSSSLGASAARSGGPASPLVAQPPAGRASSGLAELKICEEWDTPRVQEEDGSQSPCNRTLGTFACTRGGMGVTGLSLSAFGQSLMQVNSKLIGTMSSPDAVHGSINWVRGETIGRGSLGTVFQAMNQEDGTVFAVKEVQINQHDESDLKWKAELENEVSIGKALGKHPRIVSYLGHDYLDSCLYIYLEYMAGGSIAQVLQEFGSFEESLCVVYGRELLEGLDYLHTREPPVVHRDVKGGNILLGLDCQVKLSDFGCSKRTMETMSHTMKGSIPWMAPEVVTNVGYGRMADIWSFGCVLIEMASGTRPWGKLDNPMAAMYKIGMSKETPALPDCVSQEWKDFISLCLQRDASLRPNAKKLLEHELVRDILID